MLNAVHIGAALTLAAELRPATVDCIVTSPPYWGLRDYGVAGQTGQEPTPEAYVAELTALFSALAPALKPTGTLWLNLGDSYAGHNGGRGGGSIQRGNAGANIPHRKKPFGYKNKDLIGIPWAVAFALRSAGWYLRQDIIWAKPNAMPQSVRDRCTTAHEYVFLLTREPRYYYNAEAIAVPAKTAGEAPRTGKGSGRGAGHNRTSTGGPMNRAGRAMRGMDYVPEGGTANRRSVWNIPIAPYPGAHFATMPYELARLCVQAGCPPGGTVLDPFAGTGTSLVAAANTGRNYIGFELNPEYAAMANHRLKTELGLFYGLTHMPTEHEPEN